MNEDRQLLGQLSVSILKERASEHGVHYAGVDCFACHPNHPAIDTFKRFILQEVPTAEVGSLDGVVGREKT
jgi:hypothetical protein